MPAVNLEIFMTDLTRAGLASVGKNVGGAEAQARQLVAALEEVRAGYQRVMEANRRAGRSYAQEEASVQALTGQINGLKEGLQELEAAKQQTNATPVIDADIVARQTSNLKMQFQQVARELPSLAMGPQMFILAISNNLPMLADAIAEVRKQNELLAASGKKGVPVWKQLGSALLSWQTALVAGISLLIVYSKDIVEWMGNLGKAKSSVESLDKQMKNVNEAMKSGNTSYGENVVALKSLADEWGKLSDKASKVKWIEENRTEFDKLGISIGDVSEAETAFVNNTDDIIEAFKLRAQAAAAQSLAEDKYREAMIKRNEADLEAAKGPSASDRGKASFMGNMPTGGGIARMPQMTSYQEDAERAEEIRKKRIQGMYDEADAVEDAGDAYFRLAEAKKLESGKILSALGIGSEDAVKEGNGPALSNLKSLLDEYQRLVSDNEDRQISLMADGTEKQLAEIDLRYQRIRDKVKELEANLSKEQGGKLTDEQSAVFSEAYNSIERQQQRDRNAVNAGDNTLDARREAMNRYLQDYGTFQQKRQAITEEYNRKIAAATTEGDKLSLQKQMEEALSSLDLEKLKKGINWELVFSDMDNASKESLDKVKRQLEAFKKSDEYQNMAVDQKKVIDEALNNIQSAIIDKGGLLGDLPNQLEELAKAQDELNKAQDEYNEAMKNGTDVQKEAAQGKLNAAQNRLANQQNNVNKSTDKVVQNFRTLSDTLAQLGSSSEISLSQISALAEGIINIFSETGSKVGGIVGTALSLLDALGQQGLTGFMDNVFKNVGNAMYGAWDSLFGWTGIDFGGESDPHLEEDIKSLTSSNRALQASIDNLSNKMDDAAVADATGIYEQQAENIRKMEANTQEMMLRSLNAYNNGFLGIGGEKSSKARVDAGITDEEWEEISRIVGEEIKSSNDFFNLGSREMWNVANELPVIYGKIKDLADEGYKDAAQFMDEYIGYWQDLEELQDEYNEKLTSVSFDTVRDNFKSALLDMENSTEAFADNFERMMQQAILESMMTGTYDRALKDWYENFSETMKDGTLDKSEQENLRRQWQDIVDAASREWEQWRDLMDWEMDSSDVGSSQSPQGGVLTTMSQDSISSFEGIGRSLQTHVISLDKVTQELRDQNRADSESLMQIVNNTSYLLLIYELMEKLDRDGIKIQ